MSACHISSWLIAVLGTKLQPTNQGWESYQVCACSAVHRLAPEDWVDSAACGCSQNNNVRAVIKTTKCAFIKSIFAPIRLF